MPNYFIFGLNTSSSGGVYFPFRTRPGVDTHLLLVQPRSVAGGGAVQLLVGRAGRVAGAGPEQAGHGLAALLAHALAALAAGGAARRCKDKRG